MVNLYDKHKFISKSTLAKLAGVHRNTFSRYLATRSHVLEVLGVSPNAHKLPSEAVRYICEDYCIDLPPELQDQELLSRSELYQKFIRHLQDAEQVSLRLRLEKIKKTT